MFTIYDTGQRSFLEEIARIRSAPKTPIRQGPCVLLQKLFPTNSSPGLRLRIFQGFWIRP
jgi:hypothetical protein